MRPRRALAPLHGYLRSDQDQGIAKERMRCRLRHRCAVSHLWHQHRAEELPEKPRNKRGPHLLAGGATLPKLAKQWSQHWPRGPSCRSCGDDGPACRQL